MAVHLALLELGAPHELCRVDFEARGQKDPDYLRLNPNGMVPTLIVDGAPVYECAALLLLLGERHESSGLVPRPGSPTRALYLQWMLHLANTLQPAFRQWFYAEDFGPADQRDSLRENARLRVEATWDRLDARLSERGPHVLGESFSIADLYAVMLMRWSRHMPRPADRWPAIARLAAIAKARPSWKRLYEIEGLTEWP
jgi:glutathione S-transferase